MIAHNVYITTEDGAFHAEEFPSKRLAEMRVKYLNSEYPTFHVYITTADDPGTVVKESRPTYN